MKKLFIETRKKINPKKIDFSPLDKLPGKTISLAATIQYLGLVSGIRKYLESKNKKVILKKGAHHEAHVLGCNPSAFDKTAETLLLITDGKFHARNNAIILDKELYVFNLQKLEKITKKEIEIEKEKTQRKQNLFLNAKKIGILISTKPGQNYKPVNQLQQKIKSKLKKESYIFKTDTINPDEFENFPDVKIWLNTACPGLARDHNRIINIADVREFLD